MYNEGFGLAAETFSFENRLHANSLTENGYAVVPAVLGKIERMKETGVLFGGIWLISETKPCINAIIQQSRWFFCGL